MAIPYVIRHSIPGRIRLHIPALSANKESGRQIEALFAETPGVSRVRVNPHAASVIIEYDQSRSPGWTAIRALLDRIDTTEAVPTNGRGISPGRKLAGRSLVVFGIAGWLLPVIPGTPFVLAGALLLGREDPLVRFAGRAVRRCREVVAPARGNRKPGGSTK